MTAKGYPCKLSRPGSRPEASRKTRPPIIAASLDQASTTIRTSAYRSGPGGGSALREIISTTRTSYSESLFVAFFLMVERGVSVGRAKNKTAG